MLSKNKSFFFTDTHFTKTILFAVCTFLISCEKTPPPQIAFYHWQTNLALTATESLYLNDLSADRMYVKCFDVDWNFSSKEAIPKAILQYDTLPNIEIVPTVFITNRTFQQIEMAKLEELADRIYSKINTLFPNRIFTEIQLDCDWSVSTRQTYFTFLETFKNKLPAHVHLSATIRLHQFRYPNQTGVPPADRGMLMFYNMGEIKDWEERNSILNLTTAQSYLTPKNYALPLDFALPLFRWGVLFREGKMIKIINNLSAGQLASPDFFIQKKAYQYEVIESTYLDGYYLYKGDQIRLEEVAADSLFKAAELLQQIDRPEQSYLTFYHLDDAVLEKFSTEQLEKTVHLFAN